MSIAQQRIAPAAAGHRRDALVRAQTKFHPIARSDSDMPLAPPMSHTPQRPDRTILNEAIPLFAIGRNKAGLWVARDCDSSVGGAFWSKAAAIRFAKRINGSDCALMFVADGLELDQASPQAAGGPYPVASQIAKAMGAVKRRARRLRRARCGERSALIEAGLYCDDDLPTVR